jgi:hypothetical protein
MAIAVAVITLQHQLDSLNGQGKPTGLLAGSSLNGRVADGSAHALGITTDAPAATLALIEMCARRSLRSQPRPGPGLPAGRKAERRTSFVLAAVRP